jgi:hypothetical protein
MSLFHQRICRLHEFRDLEVDSLPGQPILGTDGVVLDSRGNVVRITQG